MIQHLPAQPERVETGPVQFGDDWPGVFIRGDNALFYAFVLARLRETKLEDLEFSERYAIGSLQSDLESCAAGQVAETASLARWIGLFTRGIRKIRVACGAECLLCASTAGNGRILKL